MKDRLRLLFTGFVGQNYYFGFTQLSEVAVKALSPGINDPGIACLCIRYLTDLLVVLYGRKEKSVYRDKAGKVRLVVNRIGYGELLNRCITPIRQYGAKDISVARDLLWLLSVLGARDAPSPKYRHLLNDHANSIRQMVREKLIGETDKATINAVIEKMERIQDDYFFIKKV